MTLLEEFIFSLNKIERAKLRPLQFRGAKRKIFLKILGCREGDGIDTRAIIVSSKLTKNRYYQVTGEILTACYHDVAPSGGIELLQYLGNMQLYRHFYLEMRRQEVVLLKKKNNKDLEDFYFKVLLMCEFFLMPRGRGENIRSELTKYLHRYSLIKDPHPCDECFLRCSAIDEEISQNFAREFSIEKLRASTDELEDIFECLKDHDHALAKFKVTYALAMIYFGNFFKDKNPYPYIAYMERLVNDHADIFGSVAGLISLGIKSYSPPNEVDIEYYKKFLNYTAPTGEESSLVFIERFLPIIIKAGEFSWAKKFIAERFPINIGQLRKNIAIHWWRLLLIYHSYSGEYREAEVCLQKAFSANTGILRSTDLDINLRCYEVFITIMQEGPDLASDYVLKHIRYAHRHGYNKGEGFMMLFLKAVYDLVNHSVFDKDHALKVRINYRNALDKEERLYALFEKIFDTFFR